MKAYRVQVTDQLTKTLACVLLAVGAFILIPAGMAQVERLTTHQCVGSYGVTVTCNNAPKTEKVQNDPNPAPTETACIHGVPTGNDDKCVITKNRVMYITDGSTLTKWAPVQ